MGITKYVVEGANFVATIVFDDTNFDDGFKEAATRVVENLFGHGPDSEESENFDVVTRQGEHPAIGFVISVCKNGDIGNERKLRYCSCTEIAKNAGLVDMVRFYESIGMP